MNFCTVGKTYYPGYSVAICVTNDIHSLESDSAKDFYKILYMESGTMHIQLNRNEYILTGANSLCLNEKDEIVICDTHEHPVSILYFKPSVINSKFEFDSFDYELALSSSEYQDLFYLRQFRHESRLSSKLIALQAMDSTVLRHKLNLLGELLDIQDTASWPCRSRSYLFEILFMLVRPVNEEESLLPVQIDSRFSKLSIDVIHYLQTSYDQKVTVDQLALHFHTNRTTLLADFKKSTGQSINRYVTRLRMTMAAALLRDTELSVNEICERTGFSDISYFSKSFKKEILYTPSQYRRINVS